jgi:hypothetical protein
VVYTGFGSSQERLQCDHARRYGHDAGMCSLKRCGFPLIKMSMANPDAASDWGPFLRTTIGALIGLWTQSPGRFWLLVYLAKERQSVAAAFAGEIHAILGFVGWRRAREAVLN